MDFLEFTELININESCLQFWQFDKSKGESVFRLAFTTTICVLVITCPYALVLATSIAMRVGCGVAAVHGILIRTEKILEFSSQV